MSKTPSVKREEYASYRDLELGEWFKNATKPKEDRQY